MTHLRWEEEDKQSCRQTCHTFSNIVDGFPLVGMAEVSRENEANNKNEIGLGLNSLVAEDKSEGRQTKDASIDGWCFPFEAHDFHDDK